MADSTTNFTKLGHSSPWPITASAGLFIGVFGLLFIMNNSPIGWVLSALGGGIFLIAIFSWLTSMIKQDIAEAAEKSVPEFPDIGKWMVGFLIVSEVFLFGALFATYFYLRNHDQVYTQSLLHFYLVDGKVFEIWGLVPILNTIFLVSSSVTLHFAERALRQSKTKLFQVLLITTVVLGVLFVGGQVLEYFNFAFNEHFTPQTSTFGSSFYTLTTLHGLHVLAGTIILGSLVVGSFFKSLSAKRHMALTVASVYWHFVDVIWILLVIIIYLRLI